jgi:hypothetical protein
MPPTHQDPPNRNPWEKNQAFCESKAFLSRQTKVPFVCHGRLESSFLEGTVPNHSGVRPDRAALT